jgi:hypothetical protein
MCDLDFDPIIQRQTHMKHIHQTALLAAITLLVANSVHAIEHRIFVSGDSADALVNGQALRSAIAQIPVDTAHSWLIEAGPGAFNISGSQALTLPNNVNLRGAGRQATYLFSNAVGVSERSAIVMLGVSEISSMAITHTCFGGTKTCVGIEALALAENVYRIGALNDVLLAAEGGAIANTAIKSAGRLRAFNSNFRASGGAAVSLLASAVELSGSAYLELDTSILISSRANNTCSGIVARDSAQALVKNSTIAPTCSLANSNSYWWQAPPQNKLTIRYSELLGKFTGSPSCVASIFDTIGFRTAGCGAIN